MDVGGWKCQEHISQRPIPYYSELFVLVKSTPIRFKIASILAITE